MKVQMQHRTAAELSELMQAGCLGMRVSRLHKLVAREFDQALSPLGLTMSQLEILSALKLRGEPTKPAVLAARLSTERSTTSRNLALMQHRGWVATAQHSPTGRSMAVAITPDGIAMLAEAKSAWTEAQTAVDALLGADALATLDQWVGAMTDRQESPE